MGLFGKPRPMPTTPSVVNEQKQTGYVEQMKKMSEINLSLLSSMLELQEAVKVVVSENEALYAELEQIKKQMQS